MNKYAIWIALFAIPMLYALSRCTPSEWHEPLGLGLHWSLATLVLVWVYTKLDSPKDIGLGRPLMGFACFVFVVAAYCAGLNLWFGSQSLENWQWSMPGVARFGRWGYMLVAISAGFCEEVIYRGYMMTSLKRAGHPAWAAMTLSSISFLLFHGILPLPIMISGFVVAMIWAAVVNYTSILWITIYFHALWNATVVLVPWGTFTEAS